MRPFSVDANAIADFQRERIIEEPGEACAAIAQILSNNCIALDETGLCEQEWLDAAAGHFPFSLADWIATQIPVGKVRFFALSSTGCRKALSQAGLPADDHKWVRLAIGSAGNVIVSGDIDFFEPKLKRASSRVKAKLRASRGGTCAKMLRKKFGVEVLCVEHVQGFLSS